MPESSEPDERAAKRRNRGVLAALIGVLMLGGVALGVWLQPFGDGTTPPEETAGPALTQVPLAGVDASLLEPGQCIQDYVSAWEPRFEVVDCAAEHSGQLLAEVEATTLSASDEYPGEEALRDRAQITCQASDVLDTAAASAVPGLLIEASYPLDQADWDSGLRGYRCFASTPGAATTGSLAANP
ncbi:MAG: septum formation family protein [Pseudoclavibacter sp.]